MKTPTKSASRAIDTPQMRSTSPSIETTSSDLRHQAAAIERILWPRKLDLLGVQVSSTDYGELTQVILQAARQRQSSVVSCHAVHSIITANRDPELCRQVNCFEAITPDGQPVRWALNWLHGTRLSDRVYGPELMLRICAAAGISGVPIYLYGGTSTTLEKLSRNLVNRFPGLHIAGCDAPPFRELTDEEAVAAIHRINGSGAGIAFIGLGCPKQDRFAFRHKHEIRAVQVCVGAAFDFHAGVKAMAPPLMQRSGLEWLFRFTREPKRLWKRYLVTNSLFILKMFAQALTIRDKQAIAAHITDSTP